MSPKVTEWLKTGAVALGLLGIVVLLVVDTVHRRTEKAADLVVRTKICANVCVEQESSPHSVWNQHPGWSVDEWRCGCMNGHVQVIP